MPKVEESIKALYVSMDESKKRTAMFRAKREFLEKAFSSDCFHNNDEDLKMIGVSSIDSLFSKIEIDDKGTEEESTLARRRPDNSEGKNLVEKIDKSGFAEVKTLTRFSPSKLSRRLLTKLDSSIVPFSSILILLNKESIEETPTALRSSSFL